MRKDLTQRSTSVTYAELAGPTIAAALSRETVISLNQETIAELAYRLWEDRGRPHGSPEYDWFLAEELLRSGAPFTVASI
jgi:hypothetical protein